MKFLVFIVLISSLLLTMDILAFLTSKNSKLSCYTTQSDQELLAEITILYKKFIQKTVLACPFNYGSIDKTLKKILTLHDMLEKRELPINSLQEEYTQLHYVRAELKIVNERFQKDQEELKLSYHTNKVKVPLSMSNEISNCYIKD